MPGLRVRGGGGGVPELDHPGHKAALGHKRQVVDRFRDLAEAEGVRDPQGLAEQLLLVMDGAWSAARVFGPGSYGHRVAQAAKALIAAQVETGRQIHKTSPKSAKGPRRGS